MRYVIIGSVQAIRDTDEPVPLGGARLRALLTALALRPGRAVPHDTLIDEVWEDAPPADAPAALQALVGRLRRALGRERVASDAGGYRLVAARDAVDLYLFDRLAREAARALTAVPADPAAAEGLAGRALALWREPADQAPGEPGRWATLRRETVRTRLAAALDLGGRAEALLPELDELCAGHPLDEPAQGLRIRALRDAGRPAEALAAYEEVRRGLADRLGADPGPALRALHRELLDPGPAAPVPGPVPAIAPTPTPVPAPADDAAPAPGGLVPAPELPAPVPGNLRARLTTFVGRDEDIAVLGADLARSRLVTLLGPGGAGKTRLSQEAAEAHGGAGAWPDGVWMVELAPVDDPEDVPEAALAALGARETRLRGAAAEELRQLTDRTGDDPLTRLAEHCARRRMLILLDNCEHVVAAAARLADHLLARCPGVRILATSREPLGVPGELLRPLDPLPDPAALRLLADRGRAVRPGFDVTADPGAAAEICRRLDGMPLAIELAAARLRMLTPRQIADRLDDRFRLLTGGARTVLPRQQTLRAVVDWSWDLLDAEERTVLRRLSVFAGGCDLTAAEAVCADPDAPAGPGADGEPLFAADVLGQLVDKSLVIAEPDPHAPAGSAMRYRLLETVSEYAAARLDEVPGDRAAAERRHLVHFRELVRAVEPRLRGREQRAGAALLGTEYENIRSALRRAVAARDESEALCLVHGLIWYWGMHDLRGETRHWADAIAELGPDPFAAPVVPAEPVLDRVLDVTPPYAGELLTEARRGIRLLQLASRDDRSEEWQTPETQAVVDGILASYRPGLPQTCRTPGTLWIYAVMINGDPELLARTLDATVETARELGFDWELATALQMRANVLANRVEWAGDATRDAEESLAIHRRLGDDWGCAEALSARAEARERAGDWTAAVADYREAVRHATSLGASAQVTVLKVRMAGVLGELDEGDTAEDLLTEVLSGPGEFGNEALPAARMFLATRYGRTGRLPEARAQIALLREEFASGAYAVFEGFLLGVVAWLDNLERDWARARVSLRGALAAAADPLALLIAPQMTATYFATGAVALSGVAAETGEKEPALDAVRLLGAYRARLPAGHHPVFTERASVAEAEERTRALLAPEEWERAHAEGGDLSVGEATALV
ncbi:AfsR/SARP family transcriptional regulator [Streptomyces sp. BI20]|uniref:AfsR/SARP family transcriptional regulator n=1 Tax=Streptomyces sp. BI20 TaxID=3403460 RepID=UPI003C75178F